MRTAEEIKSDIAVFDKKVREKQKQIDAMEKEVNKLLAEQDKLRTELYELEEDERTNKLLQSIFSVTKRNSIEETLFNTSSTTYIMENFVNRQKRFLLFRNAFLLQNDPDDHSKIWHLTLVVTKCHWNVRYHYSGLVMTDLKKAVDSYITANNMKYMNQNSRLYPLYSELVIAGRKQLERGKYVPFETPCMLGGQTLQDQTGFGWEYHGEDLIRRGKEYGETTKFLIIGVRVEY